MEATSSTLTEARVHSRNFIEKDEGLFSPKRGGALLLIPKLGGA